MAGAQKTSQFPQASSVATTDEVPLLQGGVLKRVTVAKLTGSPDFGWSATGESWTFSSWTSSTRIGVVTVPSDATQKYTPGMRVRIQQTTGGIKYALIMRVTSTALHLLFQVGVSLANEAISSPVYSPLVSPVGFDRDPVLWSFQATMTVTTMQNSPVAGTIYNPGGLSLALGVGAWNIEHQGAWASGGTGGTSGQMDIYTGLSTSPSTRSDPEMEERHFQAGAIWSSMKKKSYTHTSPTTYYATLACSGTCGQLAIRGEQAQTTYGAERNLIKAVPANL